MKKKLKAIYHFLFRKRCEKSALATAGAINHYCNTSSTYSDVAVHGEPKLTIKYFYATWCGPCKRIHSKVERFRDCLNSDISMQMYDCDMHTDLARDTKIYSVPQMVIYTDGRIACRFRGTDDIMQYINNFPVK